MKLPVLFNREKSSAARRERQAEVERLLTDGLRTLSGLFTTLADRLEKQRLERDGYKPPGSFLKRDDSTKR